MKNFAPIGFALSLLAGALIWAALAPAANSQSGADGTTAWTVKVTNLTVGPDGQPDSPPVWAVHNDKFTMWQVGQQATNGAALIGEDAIAEPLAGLMKKDKNILASKVELPPATDPPTPPPILPGSSRTFTIVTKPGYETLSMMWMLVRTNDAFSGLSKFTVREGKFRTRAYDVGSEKNNEDPAFIPGPPYMHPMVRDPSAELIRQHPNLSGGLKKHRWNGPVNEIEIKKAPAKVNASSVLGG